MKAADPLEVDQLVEKFLDDEWYAGIRPRQYQHRHGQQHNIREQIRAQVAVQPLLQGGDELHVPTISSAVIATGRAAPGVPNFSRSARSAPIVSSRTVGFSSASAARTRLRAFISPCISSGTIFLPARMLGIPMKSTPVMSIRPRI